jgi:Domain of unknown function (DUF4234)
MSVTANATGVNAGPAGHRRGVLFVLLLSLITLGIYTLYWAYKTHEEMRRHTGDGIGGILGLVIWIIISPISAFVIPSEIGKMYAAAGRQSPVTGWTGLWLFPFGILLIPAIVWFVKVQGALNRYWETTSATAPSSPPLAA